VTVIRIAAAVIRDRRGRTLLVRKRGTAAFMQAGGKIEPGETPAAALARELAEELGLEIEAAALAPLGRFAAPAANEPGCTVEAELFALDVESAVTPTAEIAEALWIDPAAPPPIPLAPLTRDHALALAMLGGVAHLPSGEG
jgi:8-oxo-dGTP pyrophosphatase MutT (NUDIX family)